MRALRVGMLENRLLRSSRASLVSDRQARPLRHDVPEKADLTSAVRQ